MTDPVVATFDRVAAEYDAEIPFFAAMGAQLVERLPEPTPGAPLLDLGAGAGAISVPAARAGYAVSAVDAAPAMVARLSTVVSAHLADVTALPFPDASFDVVTAGFLLHIVADPGAALAEIKRVLRPGGLLAFTIVGSWPEGFEAADGAGEIFGEFAAYLPPGGSMGHPFDAQPALSAAGFREIIGDHLRVDLPVDSPETMWRWYLSHGSSKFIADLPAGRRAEFRARILADLHGREPLTLRRAAEFWTARA